MNTREFTGHRYVLGLPMRIINVLNKKMIALALIIVSDPGDVPMPSRVDGNRWEIVCSS